MLSPLMFPGIAYSTLLSTHFCNSTTPIVRWLAFGKLPENPVVTPTTSIQVVQASAENKFLQTVTVNPIPTTSTGGA